jgi:hypothetical protein
VTHVSDAAALLPVHRLHDEDVERLLASGERRTELVALFGEQAWRELRALARRAADTRAPRGGPRVYVLPGLMGSRIGTRGTLLDDVLWVDLVEIAAGHLTRLALPGGARLVALGAMLLNALKLKLSLRVAGFDAHLHAFDWRRSHAELADALNARIAAEAGARPVLLVGHSMGGVVARLALARQPGAQIRRVVQLGAPNHGSYAPVLALRAVYPTVRKLAAIDRRHDAEDLARLIFRTLPALHELLPDPVLAGGPDLFDATQWPDDTLRPDPAMLREAARERSAWPRWDERCLQIVGVRQDTVTGVSRGGAAGPFEYSVAPLGDGTVPLALCTRPGERAWFVGEKHGGLPNNGRVIAAVVDLLRTGTTRRLPQAVSLARLRRGRNVSEAALRRVAPHKVDWRHLTPDARRRLLEPVVSPEFHGAVTPDALEPPVAARGAPRAAAADARTLELRLHAGSIVDANAHALVLGVFRNVDPSGPAAAVDAVLGGAIREFTLRRMFAGQLGQVFVMPAARSALLAELVLFAGLGEFDQFGPDAQAFAAENVVRTFAHTHVEDFATVPFGAGSGVPVALAVEQQLRGFLAGLRHGDPQRIVRRITLCELDRRKYAIMAGAVRRFADAWQEEDVRLVVDETQAAAATARRPARRERGGAAAAQAAARRSDPCYLLVNCESAGRGRHACRSSLLTAGSKAAVLSGTREFSRRDLDSLLAPLERGGAPARELARIGTALSRTLLAPSVRAGLESLPARPLVVVHDREASRVPWEVLRIGTAQPALAAGLSRRYVSDSLSVARWRDDRPAGDVLRVLLVVDPTGDLPGAAAEGHALERRFAEHGVAVDLLEGRTATRERLLAALGAGSFDVLHFAGHAFFDPADPGRGGLVCAGQDVLRGADLDGVGNLPALVFCNACEAARVRRRTAAVAGASHPRLFGLARSSTGIAEAFLSGGVANFIGTHWPVADQAAETFSTTLYAALLGGVTLGEAVLASRRGVAAAGSPDWADYVHFGTADFRLAVGATP